MMSANLAGAEFDSQPANGAVARIINGEATSGYQAVGIVNNGCTGTLISPTHVLTAAHCTVGVGDRQGTFDVNGQTYSTTDITDHPQYNDNQFDVGYDISIMELSRPVAGVDPIEIYRQVPQVGQSLTIVGFGEGGTGNSGGQGDFGNKRVGTTPIDEVTDQHISWNFDSNSESNTARGDSGGPAFVTVGGELFVAGVTSGGSNDDSSLGDFSFDTRVDVHANWIDSIVGDANPNPTPTPDPDPTPTPDPTPDPGPDPVFDDHGNDIDSATEVQLDDGFAFVGGDLEEAGDRDLFAISLEEPSEIELSLSSVDGELDTLLRVYDASGNLVGSNDDSNGTFDSALSETLEAGDYFISAGSYADQGTGEYELELGSIPLEEAPSDDLFADAVLMELDSRGRGRIRDNIEGEESHVYEITADQTGRLSLRTRALSGDLDTQLTVYDSDGNEVAFNDDWRGLDSRVRIDVEAGETYYVEVTTYEGQSAGDYLLVARNRPSSRAAGGSAIQMARATARSQALYAAIVDSLFADDQRN